MTEVTRTYGGPDVTVYPESRFANTDGERVLVAEPGHDYLFASEDDVPADGRWFPQGEGPTRPPVPVVDPIEAQPPVELPPVPPEVLPAAAADPVAAPEVPPAPPPDPAAAAPPPAAPVATPEG